MKDRQKIEPVLWVLTFQDLQETGVVAIFLTMRCVEAHVSRFALSIACWLLGTYSKEVLNPSGQSPECGADHLVMRLVRFSLQQPIPPAQS